MKSDNKLALFFRKIGKRLKEDKVYSRTFYSIIAVLIALIVVIIVSVSCSKKEDNGADNEISADSVSENQTAGTVDYTVPDVALAEDAYADVNALVNQYFAAMTTGDTAAITAMKDTAAQEDLIKIEKESAYIDEFDNIKVYTKPGPLTDSYVAFAYYEIKFKDISTLAPGLTTLYICPREDGSLYICDGDLDDNTTAYIKSVVAQDDVVDLFSMVETKYAEAIDADADLSGFMDNLSAKLDEEVSQAMAQAEGNTEEATDATDAAQEEQPAEEEQPTENVMEEQVTAQKAELSSCLSSALNAGELLLTHGAEVSRVEDTVQRIGRACGFERVDVFTITSYIAATAFLPDGTTMTESRRIKARVTGLGKVEEVNALSRHFCHGEISLEEFRDELRRVREEKTSPWWLDLLMYMVISFSLSIFLGGTFPDGIASALSGMVLYGMICMSAHLQMNSLIQTSICSAVTAIAVLLLVRLGIGVHPDKIMIGNIMLVIPGMQLTNSLRDMINGDTVSGVLNLSEAILKAVSVALGFAIVLLAGG